MAGIERHVVPIPDVGAVHDLSKSIPWDLDFRVLEDGRSAGSIETVSTARVSLSRFRFPWKLHQRGAVPREGRTFGLGVEPGQRVPFCGYPLVDDWLVGFPGTSDFDAQSSESFHTYGLTVDEASFQEAVESLGLQSLADSKPRLTVYGAARVRGSGIRESLKRIFKAARQASPDTVKSGLARTIDEDLVVRLLHLLSGEPPESKSRIRQRDRALKRCMEFIEQSGRRLIGVQELRKVSGASWRTLDYAFQERFGVTPQAYLRARRMNAVHAELRNARPERGAVSRVAGAWEFWHMGDFAGDYRKLFGELPSETLSRK